MIERPSPNHGPRPPDTPVDMLVLHYTGMRDAEAALARLTDPAAAVSAHYLIAEDGTVVRLVPEDRRAWHAGVASWRGATDVNGRSLGIELVNPGHEHGYRAFPGPQMAALAELAATILDRHPIPARNVVGHSDVAPDRKEDPGELFDWAGLAEAGVGLWPKRLPVSASVETIPQMLSQYGYDLDRPGVMAAFQRHFRPRLIDGATDEECARILAALLQSIEDGA